MSGLGGRCFEWALGLAPSLIYCGRGLAPVQTGDIVYISNGGHGLQVNAHDQEVADHALESRVPHEPTNQAGL